MVSKKNNKLLIILLSLITATAASAAPTMCDCNKKFVDPAVSATSDVCVPYTPEKSQITEPSNSHLAAIGAEILKPPADFINSPPPGLKTLPAVPASIFIAITGFLCVSLVKDRKLWLAALAGLLWAGQAGFHAIPQLTAHISKKHIQRKSYSNAVTLHQLEESCRLRSNIEGTQYIGLLRHLAGIPAGKISSIQSPMSFLPHISMRDKLQQIRNTNEVPQFAITHFSSLPNPVVICPAPAAEQYILFSPAFIFEQLARGPPISA